jgi:hypothetical protein
VEDSGNVLSARIRSNFVAHQGIDYGLGKTNIDTDTAIRYGVISQNSINLDMSSDWGYDYGKPTCPTCGQPAFESDHESVADADWNDGKDYACAQCETCYWSESAYSEEALGWTFEDSEYSLTDCLDNDIFVLRSPYYTYSQFCSPCVPGAGNLDNPVDGGVKTYALGPRYFDQYNPMPYRCYRVTDDLEVFCA